MTLKFNPPKQVARYALFLDYGEGHGYFKVYNLLGSAKNAYHNHYNSNGAKILENVEGEWYTLFDIPASTEAPWMKEVQGRGYGYSHSSYTTKRSKPMTREEYAEWRLKVEREKVASKNQSLTEQLENINR